MNTSKLFHAVVLMGMSVGLEMACSSTESGPGSTEATTADAGTSASASGSAGQGGSAGASSVDGSSVSSSSGGTGGDAMAGWFCCG